VFTGEPMKEENRILKDLSGREIALLAPLAALVILLGLYPKILLDKTAPSTEAVLDRIVAETSFEIPEAGRLAGLFLSEVRE